jgi:predicted RNA-binding Zn-ribbon protein involved in translation (DUF1610 family)
MKINRVCEKCGGIHIVKAGLSKSNYQLYQCQDCKHKFTETGLKIGRQKINFDCSQCDGQAVAKGLCRKCYTKSLKKNKLI